MERALRKVTIRSDEPQESTATYAIHAMCQNCDWTGEIQIPKGTPVEKGAVLADLADCPECACYTLMHARSNLPPVAPVGTPAWQEDILQRLERAREYPNWFRYTPVIETSPPSTYKQPGYMYMGDMNDIIYGTTTSSQLPVIS